MNRLDDKVALITGGARGMGAAEADWTHTMTEITHDHGRLDVLINNAGIFRL